jgi:hypothetical protein
MPTTRTFTLLSEVPNVPITSCTQILLNRLQCWKPGAVLVKEVVTPDAPDEANSEVVKGSISTYQLCRGHASILKQLDDIEAVAQAPVAPPDAGTPQAPFTPSDPAANSLNPAASSVVAEFAPPAQKATLAKEAVAQQTTIPQGENSPNNK